MSPWRICCPSCGEDLLPQPRAAEFGDLYIDEALRVCVGREIVRLAPTPTRLLYLLISRPEQMIHRERLLTLLGMWETDTLVMHKYHVARFLERHQSTVEIRSRHCFGYGAFLRVRVLPAATSRLGYARSCWH